jgi:hypothetical protein
MISVPFAFSSSLAPRSNKIAAESLVILSMFQELDGMKILTTTTMSSSSLAVVWIEPTSNGERESILHATKKCLLLTLLKSNNDDKSIKN